MDNENERHRAARVRRIRWWAVAVVVALAVAATAGLIWLGQLGQKPSPVAVASNWNVKGNPNAPVEVEEWVDFQ